ncbi:MAG: M14 family zinc carboxypeptidase [Phycisphaerae bacterium]
MREMPANLLKNSSFKEGDESPSHWEWVVQAGLPVWSFDFQTPRGQGRSICILQDGQSWHGEFRQKVRCKGGRRYRLSGWIKVANEGTGSQSGANLCIRAFARGRQIHDLWFRPFFVGREEWRLWSIQYVAPCQSDSLLVSFDMRRSGGCAWFSDLELIEVSEPVFANADLTTPAAAAQGPALIKRAAVVIAGDGRSRITDMLEGLLGRGNVTQVDPRGNQVFEGDALLVCHHGKKPVIGGGAVLGLCEDSLCVLTPESFAAAFEKHVKCRVARTSGAHPPARIVADNFLTTGFAKGDVIPWFRRADDGRQEQPQVAVAKEYLKRLDMQVIATADGERVGSDGPPVILWRPGERGGLLVMDIEMLNARPDFMAYENLAATILCNAFGRPQAYFGRFVYPGYPRFDFDGFRRQVQAVAAAHPSIELREEGRSRLGRPIYSLAIGPKHAPTVYVDCGIHSDEWAPCYGSLLYLDRLAGECEAGHPLANALVGKLRLKVIPLLSPDGWDDHVRFIRDHLDLNRNFPVNWESYTGGSKGSGPLSEPEARIVANIFRRENLVAAVNWHETTANTNWVGLARLDGRYRKYATAVPAIFGQLIDGFPRRHFAWQAATWTQITDPHNFHWHSTDSFPYIRDYSPQKCPYELFYADSLGIDALTIEQYGNSDLACSTSPQRTDMTGMIFEMLVGLQVGLVCRNYGWQTTRVTIPLIVDRSRGQVRVYAADGTEIQHRPLKARESVAMIEAELPPGAGLVVELDPPPWKARR